MALTHGGDVEGYILEYGVSPLDFSANCSPLGVPGGVIAAVAEAARRADVYPDPLCRRLRLALSEKLGTSPGRILCGSGAADLIFRLAYAIRPKSALVTAPTFSEYELALEAAGCSVERHYLLRSDGFALTDGILGRISPGLDVLFVCNPNNPTGLAVEPALLERICAACEESGTLLVVDECFNGFLDEPEKHTLRRDIDRYRNLLILDAFTKTYGLAGVRLGFCLSADEALLEKMAKAGQPWAVSSLAQAAGIAALSEDGYVKAARAVVREERSYLRAALNRLGVEVLGGDANYIFFYTEAADLAARMRSRGILIRDCSNYAGLGAGYFRVAVRTHGENVRLVEALAGALGRS